MQDLPHHSRARASRPIHPGSAWRGLALVVATSTIACHSRGTAEHPPAPGGAPYTTTRTGDVHDFDFLVGDWTGKNRRLEVRGVGSNDWDEFPGNGRAVSYLGGVTQVEEVSFPTKGWSGLTIRTFDVAARQWSIYWISSKTGVMFPPVVGGFQGDRGEFYGEDQDDGRPIKVRFVWTRLGAGRGRWEQAFSAAGGRTWEPKW
jgi:hypothetical protein